MTQFAAATNAFVGLAMNEKLYHTGASARMKCKNNHENSKKCFSSE